MEIFWRDLWEVIFLNISALLLKTFISLLAYLIASYIFRIFPNGKQFLDGIKVQNENILLNYA